LLSFKDAFKYWDKRNHTMDLAEVISKDKAKNVGESVDSARLFNAVF
jgi:hypothetical protein